MLKILINVKKKTEISYKLKFLYVINISVFDVY